MTKISCLFMFMALFFAQISPAQAAFLLWGAGDVVIYGESYVVSDRSSNDRDTNSADINQKYKGYTSKINDYSGYYLGTFSGNTESGNIANTTYYDVESNRAVLLIDYYVSYYNNVFNKNYKIDLNKIYKTDIPDDPEEYPNNFITEDQLTVTWNNGLQSGTWMFNSNGIGLGFYVVKGSQEFSLYFVDPSPQIEGIWTTRHLLTPTNGNNPNQSGNIPSLSHFVGVPASDQGGEPGPNPPSVPEPGTMLLLGVGLLGLGFVARRPRH